MIGYLTHVLEDEQAENLCCWTEATLLRYQSCGCNACATMVVKVRERGREREGLKEGHLTTAVDDDSNSNSNPLLQAIRMAQPHVTKLFSRLSPSMQASASSAAAPTTTTANVTGQFVGVPGGEARWRSVGRSLARICYCHISLLMDSELSPRPLSHAATASSGVATAASGAASGAVGYEGEVVEGVRQLREYCLRLEGNGGGDGGQGGPWRMAMDMDPLLTTKAMVWKAEQVSKGKGKVGGRWRKGGGKVEGIALHGAEGWRVKRTRDCIGWNPTDASLPLSTLVRPSRSVSKNGRS